MHENKAMAVWTSSLVYYTDFFFSLLGSSCNDKTKDDVLEQSCDVSGL